MSTMLILGGIMLFLAVALGAFGAHALKEKLNEAQQKTYQTGILYHLIHGLGLVLIGLYAGMAGHASLAVTAGWFIAAGIVLFSGSLYALSLTGMRKLGAITPLGGVAFLAGWILFIVAAAQG